MSTALSFVFHLLGAVLWTGGVLAMSRVMVHMARQPAAMRSGLGHLGGRFNILAMLGAAMSLPSGLYQLSLWPAVMNGDRNEDMESIDDVYDPDRVLMACPASTTSRSMRIVSRTCPQQPSTCRTFGWDTKGIEHKLGCGVPPCATSPQPARWRPTTRGALRPAPPEIL